MSAVEIVLAVFLALNVSKLAAELDRLWRNPSQDQVALGMVFRTGLDGLHRSLVSSIALMLFAAIAAGASRIEEAVTPLVGILAAALFMTGLGAWIWRALSTVYCVAGDTLHVRSCARHVSVPLAEIRSVAPVTGQNGPFVMSPRQLSIHHGNCQQLLVSPSNRDGFLAAIGHPFYTRIDLPDEDPQPQ